MDRLANQDSRQPWGIVGQPNKQTQLDKQRLQKDTNKS